MKKARKLAKSIVSFALAAVLAIPTGLVVVPAVEAQAASVNFVTPEDLYLIYSTEYDIAPGVVETQYVTNTADGSDQEMGYALTIDLKNPSVSIGAGYNNYDGTSWGMQQVRKQAAAAEKKTGKNVVAGVNADFFNMATGRPQSALVMDGVIYSNNKKEYPCFAIMEDGTAAILPNSKNLDGVKEAVGGSVIMLVDGEIPTGFADAYYTGKEPRTAAGIKADGTVVLFVGDGRQYPKSSGLTIYELAKMMKALGCVTAINLDGGGSSTFATEREGSDELLTHNSPSDGVDREVSSSLLVFSTAKSDGVFNHAVLTPNNDAYTPYANVQFSAAGVDAAGGPATLPENVSYSLAASSADMGTISANGLFASNGKEGNVDVNLLLDGEVVGSTNIVIVAPDDISFSNEEVSMGFSNSSDLGLVVKANGRNLICNSDDFVWTLSDSSMGSFDGNIFTSSDSATVTGTITCAYKYNTEVSGSVTAIIGKLPTIVWDFENVDEYAGLYTSNYARGGIDSCEIVSIDDGEPVRFGQRSMKLNYNFINCGAVTEGACVGMTEAYEIPGVPTGIGVWVYAPEGTAPTAEEKAAGVSGFWLRGYFTDGAGRQQAFDYTFEPKQVDYDLDKSGIFWEGWHYCEASLTSYAAPYSIEPGMTFRLMYVAGTGMGTKTAGSIYFDNLQFVYGANVDDIDSPVVDTIQGNDVEITDGMVFDTNTITFSSTFHDVDNKYMTGIDYDVARMYIDGVNVVEDPMYVLDKGGNKSWFYDVKLANGQHSVKMLLRDGFGNETTETRFFTVNAAENQATTLDLTADGMPVLGETFALKLTASDIADIKSAKFSVKLDDHFTVKNVEFAPGFAGTYSYRSKELAVEAAGKATTDSNVIATVYFDIPDSLQAGIAFTYYTTLGSFETESGNGTTNSFAVSPQTIQVSAPLAVSADPIIVGCAGIVKVTDIDGNGVEGAKVLYNGSSIGTTNAEGILETNKFSSASGKYEVSAEKNGGVSYNTTLYAVNAVGTKVPYNVLSNAVTDGNSQKSFSWMSNVLESNNQAVLQIAAKSDYEANGEAAFTDVNGSFIDKVFTGGAESGYSTVRVNSAKIDSLVAGESYIYRVGDGEAWSDVKEFTLDAEDNKVNFFIIGDIQAKDLSNNTKVINGILSKKNSYTFGMQTGDSVDGASVYGYWDELLGNFEDAGLGNIDMVHVLGNHEYEGDEFAQNGQDIYTLPSGTCYSMEYDNLYIAVINYKSTDSAVLEQTMDWLIEDANKSDAQWKILAMHQPPYYTNIAGGGAFINTHLPAAIDAAGINMVFSGHDHSLARTAPMTAGQVDEENGTVYYICGSTGEKSYAAVDTPEFNFRYIDDEFDAVYTVVSVDETEISVTNYNLDGSVLDSYIMSNACGKEGHQYSFDGENLICDNCGHKLNAEEEKFTGFTKDLETGKKMYLLAGKATIGSMNFGEEEYIFDENGLGVDGDYVISCKMGDLVCTCEDGLVINRNGIYSFANKHTIVYKGWENNEPASEWAEFNGKTYYFKDGMLVNKSTTIGSVIYNFDSYGVYKGGVFWKTSKGTRYYDMGVYALGKTEINGVTYYFDESTGYQVMGAGQHLVNGDLLITLDENNAIIAEEALLDYVGFLSKGNDKYYYNHGEMAVGFTEIDGDYYYFSSKGVMSVKNTTISGVTYSFDSTGKYLSGGWKTDSKGTRYYELGSYVTGWYEINGSMYYFNGDGYRLTGVAQIDDKFYTFDESGVLVAEGSAEYTGFTVEGKNTYYYEDGVQVTGWKQIDGVYYYFGTNGIMAKKATTIAGVAYKFASDGKHTEGTWKISSKGTQYFFAGSAASGWTEIDGSVYYFGKNNYMVTGTTQIDGNFYDFTEDGVYLGEADSDGFVVIDGKTYFYENGTSVTGWKQIDEATYYFDSTGVMATGTKKIDNVSCKFASDGKYTGGTWYNTSKGMKYYLAGAFFYGWNVIDGGTYFFDENGYMATGVKVIDGLFYEFGEDGLLASEGTTEYTGYLKAGSATYFYENGIKVVGWKEIDGITHYFKADGSMAIKATTISGVAYKFNADGSHVEGTWKTDKQGNTKYYFAGVAFYGLNTIDGNLYYFDEDGNVLKLASIEVEGIMYSFDENGVGSVVSESTEEAIDEEVIVEETIIEDSEETPVEE